MDTVEGWREDKRSGCGRRREGVVDGGDVDMVEIG